jgi:hypothetical protein
MDFCRSAFSSAEELELRKVVEGESGLESARIWEVRNWSLRSIIVGAEVAILMEWVGEARGLGGVVVV